MLIWQVPRWQVRRAVHLNSAEPRKAFENENEARKTFAQIVGGFAIIATLYFNFDQSRRAQQQQEIAEEQQELAEQVNLTDRFSKAVEELAAPQIQERVGGVYALQQLTLDAQSFKMADRPDIGLEEKKRVLAVLAAFLKAMSPVDLRRPKVETYEMSQDLQATVIVLADRRLHDPGIDPVSACHASLEGADLRDQDLSGLDLSDTDFENSDMSGANFMNGSLASAILERVDLSDATFVAGNGGKARFPLDGADLKDACLCGADLSASSISQSQLEAAQGNANTRYPPGLAKPHGWKGNCSPNCSN